MFRAMNLHNEGASIFVPDGVDVDAALARTTHLGIGAHPDDLEIAMYHGIAACYDEPASWFSGITCTHGSGSSRSGEFRDTSDGEMRAIRKAEQERAATIGKYSAVAQLDYSSDRDPTAAGAIAVAMSHAEDARSSQGHAEVLGQALQLDLSANVRAWLCRFRAKLQAANGRAEEAWTWFDRASQGADPELATQLAYDRGELWVVLGRHDEARAELEPLRTTERLDLRAHVLRRLGEMARLTGDSVGADTCFQGALDAADRSGSVPALLATLSSVGEYEHAAGRTEVGYGHLSRAIGLAETHDLKPALARALMLRGHAENDDGHPSDALKTLRRAVHLQRRSGHRRRLMHLLLRLGWIEAGLGESASAREHLREGRALAQVSATPLIPFFEMNLAVCELDEGRPAAAVHRLEPAVADAEKTGLALNIASMLFHRAWAYGAVGRLEDALADLDRADELCEAVAPAYVGQNYALRACLVPADRDAYHTARERMTSERNVLGAIRLLQVRQNRPDAELTAPVRSDAEKSAFGRQVLRWLEA